MQYRTLLGITFLFFLCQTYSIGQVTITEATNFDLKDTEGNGIDLFEILESDQYVVIEFFDPGCGPCQTYGAEPQDSYVNFGENQGDVFFMGISYYGSNELIDDWDLTFGIEYPTISGTEGAGNEVHVDYGVISFPTLILIAPDQSIVSQLYIPDYLPISSVIDSMLLANGITQVLTEITKENDIKGKQVNVYPNPAREKVHLTTHFAGYTILTNFLGITVKEVKHNQIENSGTTLSIVDLQPGIYFVTTFNEMGKIVGHQKLLIAK